MRRAVVLLRPPRALPVQLPADLRDVALLCLWCCRAVTCVFALQLPMLNIHMTPLSRLVLAYIFLAPIASPCLVSVITGPAGIYIGANAVSGGYPYLSGPLTPVTNHLACQQACCLKGTCAAWNWRPADAGMYGCPAAGCCYMMNPAPGPSGGLAGDMSGLLNPACCAATLGLISSTPTKTISPTTTNTASKTKTPTPTLTSSLTTTISATSTKTAICPAGYYCTVSALNSTLCPKGSFSNAGAANCTLCPAGAFTSATGSPSCQQCPGGHYCPAGTSSWARLNCGRGNYCPDGSGAPTPCPFQVPPTGGWGALQVQGPAFLVETAHCLNHCFWNFSSGDGMLSKC